MSRSALVTIRWSKTKLPLSAPATRRSEGSQRRRSGWVNICSAAVLGRHRGRDPEPERVEVAVERVGLALGGLAAARAGRRRRSRGARPAGCPRRSARCRAAAPPAAPHGHRHGAAALAVDDRDRRAPVALARDREVGGAVARRLARARPAAGRAVAGAARRPRSARRRAAIAASASSTAGMPSAAVGPKRASTSGETSTGSSLAAGPGERGAGVDHRHRRGVAGAALPAARAQLVELLARPPSSAGPALDLGVARREQDEARLARPRRACGREDGQRRRRRRRRGRARPRRCGRGCSAGSSSESSSQFSQPLEVARRSPRGRA